MAGAAAARAAQPPQPGQLDAAACARAAARLQEATGIPELHALVAHLSQLEALNFALFNECSQFNDRVGALQKELKALQVCLCVACACVRVRALQLYKWWA